MQIHGFLRHSDGSILSLEGEEICLSSSRFYDLVTNPSRCFLCGISRSDAEFNDEHVIPNWILRKCNLHNKTIQLPNGTRLKYSQYVLPCCVDYNSFLGEQFEEPIASAFSDSSDVFSEFYHEKMFNVFLWLNLIYLKVHLKNNLLRLDKDLRRPDTKIGALHDWSQLHHCHALVRASRHNVKIDVPSVIGSMFIIHLGEWTDQDPFDYKDHLPSQTIMLRIRRVAIIASLNDSCGVLQGLMPKIEKLHGELNKLQLLEIFTEFQFVNYHLKNRPEYGTILDQESGSFLIAGKIPELFDLEDLDFDLRRRILVENIYASIPNFRLDGHTIEETLEILATQDITFLPQ